MVLNYSNDNVVISFNKNGALCIQKFLFCLFFWVIIYVVIYLFINFHFGWAILGGGNSHPQPRNGVKPASKGGFIFSG